MRNSVATTFGPALILASSLIGLSAHGGAKIDPEPVCVSKQKVELHKRAGKSEPTTWTVGRYMPFLKVSEAKDKSKKSWVELKDVDGQKHWVPSSSVTTQLTCAVVRTKHAQLRQGPGSNYPLADLGTVEKYTPFLKVDRDGEWVLIEDEAGGQYWTHEKNLWIPAAKATVRF